jgi:hypothetical protein
MVKHPRTGRPGDAVMTALRAGLDPADKFPCAASTATGEVGFSLTSQPWERTPLY